MSVIVCDVRKGEKSQQWTWVCLVAGTKGEGLEVLAYLDEHSPVQICLTPKSRMRSEQDYSKFSYKILVGRDKLIRSV